MKWLLMLPVWLYRLLVSPWKPRTCRFHPTCSRYALLALRRHGAVRGSWLAARRILRCHPFTPPGFDPVPPVARMAQRLRENRSPTAPATRSGSQRSCQR